MTKRKHYLIDKRYQLRTTFSIIGTVIIITTIILGVITASVVNNSIRLNENNLKIDNIYKIESSIFIFLSSLTGPVQDQSLKKAIQESMEKHDNNMNTLGHIISTNQDIITYNKILLITILIIIILEAAALYLILIRKTHRVSGPMYVISGFMRDIIEGKEPHFRPLRNGDEMQDFYELFRHMVFTIREREKKGS
ncbi:MAG: hypothetical protein A2W19_05005 [Spirochaetes bacterium RBG_16_49_21]|nr:MAG: hypothetical protein A2W19_05005 [Spirochaetes bacterium RBG_16_49_21]